MPRDTRPSVRARLTATIFSGVALANTGYIAAITISTLAARAMTGSSQWSGLPGSVAIVGSATAATILAADVARSGYRRGLTAGYLVAAVGGAAAALALSLDNFALLLGGLFTLGFGQAAAQLSRYAAGAIATVDRRGSAVSLIVWAGTVGAILGPSLLGPAGALALAQGGDEYVGGFLVAAGFMALAFVTYLLVLRPDPATIATDRAEAPVNPKSTETHSAWDSHAWRRPGVRLALTTMVFGQFVMVLIMTGTPIHIEDTGRGLRVVGLVISAHTLGMFAFSPLVGRIVDIVGTFRVMVAAMGLLASAAVISATAPHDSTPIIAFGLFLLGVGWNAGFVAGSALLSATVGVRIQGAVDSMVWGSSAIASLASGLILNSVGYPALSLLSLILLLVPSLLLATQRSRRPVAGLT